MVSQEFIYNHSHWDQTASASWSHVWNGWPSKTKRWVSRRASWRLNSENWTLLVLISASWRSTRGKSLGITYCVTIRWNLENLGGYFRFYQGKGVNAAKSLVQAWKRYLISDTILQESAYRLKANATCNRFFIHIPRYLYSLAWSNAILIWFIIHKASAVSAPIKQ